MLSPADDRVTEVHERLLQAYGRPTWRKKLPPLDELVCTILSQNTNDVNRDQAFSALRQRFSTWEEVRDADPETVKDAIRVAGLANQKGPHIQAVLQRITDERGELSLRYLRDLPPEEVRDWLTSFKGVGPKTAAIVMLFSLDMPAFPVDTHIYRVTGRLGLRPQRITPDKAHEVLAELFPAEAYYDAHLNLIRHGREVCKAPKPLCRHCPLTDLCLYYQNLDPKPDREDTYDR